MSDKLTTNIFSTVDKSIQFIRKSHQSVVLKRKKEDDYALMKIKQINQPSFQRYRKRSFNTKISIEKCNQKHINLQNNKSLKLKNIQNNKLILCDRIKNLKQVIQRLCVIGSIFQKINLKQKCNINRQIEHLIAMMLEIGQLIQENYNEIQLQKKSPITNFQINFLSNEDIYLDSNLFLYCESENQLLELFQVFEFNQMVNQGSQLKEEYYNKLIEIMGYTRYKVQSLIQTIEALEDCQKQVQKQDKFSTDQIIMKIGSKFGSNKRQPINLKVIEGYLLNTERQPTNSVDKQIQRALKIGNQI